ncbi:MAG TPA: CopD family protein [Saprospiraceae bacterium]|nr:CopD family protein [Saprospiraceae bacterium]HMQ84664.1 CopD family protein [Saprospiraceae bacterium]
MIDFLYFLKALHVVGFISWFAGLFYLGRIFVYHEEAWGKPEPDSSVLVKEFQQMERRAYRIICNPAMNLTWVAGLGMLALGWFSPVVPNYLDLQMGTPAWMHLKLLLVFLLSGYHYWCKRLIDRLAAGERPYSSWQFRLLNEVPTLFLLSIPFIAVFGKMGRLNYLYLLIALVLFAGLIYRGAKAYQRKRQQNNP